jgi:hypothetical protein
MNAAADAATRKTGMTIEEAYQILNVEPKTPPPDILQASFIF